VGFGSGGRLWRTAVDGGQLQAIAETATGLASFRGDGMVLFSDVNKPLQRISGLGQPPSPALELDAGRGEIAQNAPQFLPDGNRFLYVSNGNNVSVMLGSLDGGASRVLFSEAGSPAYYAADADAERGWLLSSLNTGGTRQLVARPFDAATGQVVGEPLPIADALNAGPIWSASDTGILMFRRFRPSQAQYAWFSRSGSRLGVVGEPGTLGRPRLSGDQQSLAFSRTTGGNSDIWLLDLAKGISRRFTLEPGADSNPVWSADGRRMFYVSARQGEPFVVERQTSGIGAERIIMQGRPVATPTAVSSDGRWLAVSRGGGGQTQIALVSLADGKIVQVPDATSASNPSFSPDRRWLLYALNIAGRNEVFVRTLPREAGGPAADGKWQISFTGGSQAVWRADGKEILYLAEDGALMAVPVEAGADAFRTGTPTMLFQTDDAASFDVSADGMRILVDQRVVGSSDTPLTVIVNWPSLLRK
jgi:Tol biopolymer transport system component